MIRISAVEPLDGSVVRLSFTDGTQKVMDLRPLMRGPIFEPLLRDSTLFRAVRVDPALGTIMWPNGADLDPDVLYGGRAPAWMEHDAKQPSAP
jgi:hypothetical protein